MTRRLRALLLLVPLLAAAACGGSATSGSVSGSGDQGVTTVKVVHAPSTLFAPLYIADAKGYFAAQGIKIDLQTVKAGQDAIPLAASGKVDVVVAGFSAGMFNAVSSGLEIKVVGSMGYTDGTSPAPTALEVAKPLVDSGQIKSPSDLRGRKVALSGGAGGAGGYQLDAILREKGLTLTDVTPVNLAFPDMESALQNGSVAAALPPAPFTTKMEASGVATALAIPPAGTTATGVIYGGQFTKNPVAKKFFAALQKGAADAQGAAKKSDQNLQILAKYTGQTLDVLKEVPFYTWDPDLHPRTDQIQAQQQAYLDAKLLNYDKLLAPDTFIDASFAQQK